MTRNGSDACFAQDDLGSDASDAITIASTAALGVYQVCCIAGAFAYRKRRPLSVRSWPLLCVMGLFSLLNTVMWPFFWIDCKENCWVRAVYTTVIVAGHGCPILAQGCIVSLKLAWGRKAISTEPTKQQCCSLSSRLSHRRHGLVLLMVPVFVGVACTSGVKAALIIKEGCDDFVETSKWKDLAISSAEIGVFVVFALVLALELRRQHDSFGITRDLTRMAVVALLAIGGYALIRRVGKTWEGQLAFHVYEAVLPITILFLIPALETRAETRVTTHATQSSRALINVSPRRDESDKFEELDMTQILARPEGLKAFKEHLVSEFSSENIIFWLEVQAFADDFADETDKTKIVSAAGNIMEKYVKPTSEMQVNLPEKLVRQLLNLPIDQFGPQMFRGAQAEIYRLMETDSFPRFVKSSGYKQLVRGGPKKAASVRILGHAQVSHIRVL
ncbi:hypothetical protein AB1Y20_012143 [Prymnesium parvum]|uniref:RGS domain-containing protein n=1 Tax=Prymnesium parvum TaxID=97485 RepID=A0AB34INX6_PRYPA